jgi:adenylate cyclase
MEPAVRPGPRHGVVGILAGLHLAGAVLAWLLLVFVIPLPPEAREPQVRWGTTALVGVYGFFATAVVIRFGRALLVPVEAWVASGSLADEATQARVLDAPLILTRRAAQLWVGATLLGAGYNAWFDGLLGLGVGVGLGLSGMVVSMVTFLVAERLLRPLASRALADRAPRRPLERALSKRLVFTWVLSSGAGLAGLGMASVFTLIRPSLTTQRSLAVITLVFVALVSLSGFVATPLAARATAEPVEDLILALGAVEDGNLDTRVRVWDSTELGVLQAGFNAMASGLEERERIRDLFGCHVGEEVATAALLETASFDGEIRDVVVLFVDLVGSTSLAESTEPRELVRMLNAFFDIVIDVVHSHEGWINKFQGDAALAVWGAPLDVDDAATKSLAAARRLATRLRDELPTLSAGMGVSGGSVVTGNIGGARRYEYTAIGDPVNEAARLTESAKERPGGVVANAVLLDAASPDERSRWVEVDSVLVRGKSVPTRLAVPRA